MLWNTVYLEFQGLRKRGQIIPDELLQHLSPLGWEHINLTGDYVWNAGDRHRQPQLRLLRGLRRPQIGQVAPRPGLSAPDP